MVLSDYNVDIFELSNHTGDMPGQPNGLTLIIPGPTGPNVQTEEHPIPSP